MGRGQRSSPASPASTRPAGFTVLARLAGSCGAGRRPGRPGALHPQPGPAGPGSDPGPGICGHRLGEPDVTVHGADPGHAEPAAGGGSQEPNGLAALRDQRSPRAARTRHLRASAVPLASRHARPPTKTCSSAPSADLGQGSCSAAAFVVTRYSLRARKPLSPPTARANARAIHLVSLCSPCPSSRHARGQPSAEPDDLPAAVG